MEGLYNFAFPGYFTKTIPSEFEGGGKEITIKYVYDYIPKSYLMHVTHTEREWNEIIMSLKYNKSEIITKLQDVFLQLRKKQSVQYFYKIPWHLGATNYAIFLTEPFSYARIQPIRLPKFFLWNRIQKCFGS